MLNLTSCCRQLGLKAAGKSENVCNILNHPLTVFLVCKRCMTTFRYLYTGTQHLNVWFRAAFKKIKTARNARYLLTKLNPEIHVASGDVVLFHTERKKFRSSSGGICLMVVMKIGRSMSWSLSDTVWRVYGFGPLNRSFLFARRKWRRANGMRTCLTMGWHVIFVFVIWSQERFQLLKKLVSCHIFLRWTFTISDWVDCWKSNLRSFYVQLEFE